jgi:nucleoid-associated protein YgaU
MTNLLTQEEVAALARSVGFTPKNAKIASAIAMCESAASRDNKPYADFDLIGDQELANETWGYSYGGFQIRSLRAKKGTGDIRDETRLLDPEFNVRAAREIKLSQGWEAWSVYQSGAYKAYLQDLYPPPPNTYVVVSGDTLSGIGVKVGVRWTDLARWNNLHSPYTIYIGQILLLTDPTSA